MTSNTHLEDIRNLLQAYRDLDRAVLPVGVREKIKHELDTYAEATFR